ncbi:NAD(P)H-binding protein [uncultured Actinomyces sp.]|uniref:NmrA family NAD(P)-binding protein n=1 Tax=uncultured Actinomyces sp. TaxID=249061 RepID=UPI0025E40A9F|nr:NAD(P)H-binding protein [uncultured Actinomyces sp.]
MYVISGANGRIGSVVADRLLDSGHPVRAVVRRPEAAADWISRGAEAVVLDLRDSQKVTKALNGATAFFAMMPFDLSVPDLQQYAAEVVQSVSNAVKDAGVRHTVMLSSGGADLTEGTGPILGLHHMEQVLAQTGTVLTALRPGHFQEKFGDVLGAVLHEGIFPVFASSADTPLPMVATRDIAEIAVQELLADTQTSEAVDIVGPEYTERQVARSLSVVLGKPLEVVPIPEPGWMKALVEAGFAPHIAESLADLYRADEQKRLGPRGDRSIRVTTDIDTTVRHVLAQEV